MNTLFQIDIKDVIKNIRKENIYLFSAVGIFISKSKEFVSFLENTKYAPTEDLAIAYMEASGGSRWTDNKNYMADIGELLRSNNVVLKRFFYSNKMQLTKMFIEILFENLPRITAMPKPNTYSTFPAITQDMLDILSDVVTGNKPLSVLSTMDIINTTDVYKQFVDRSYNYKYAGCDTATYTKSATRLKSQLLNVCDGIAVNFNDNDYNTLLYILNILIKAHDTNTSFNEMSLQAYVNLLSEFGYTKQLSNIDVIASTDLIKLFSCIDHKTVSKKNVMAYGALGYIVNMIFISILVEDIKNNPKEDDCCKPCRSC